MRELIASLNTVQSSDILFDTCFVLYELKNHKNLKGSITSFTAEELLHLSHHMSQELKNDIRESMKHHDLSIVPIAVSPGDWKGEREFVNNADPKLLELIHDPSDAVLIAAAIKTGAKKVYTRDKHHLYTSRLGNYLNAWGIEVLNKCPDCLVRR